MTSAATSSRGASPRARAPRRRRRAPARRACSRSSAAPGNARVAAYLQRAAVGWKPDAIAINAAQKASGGFTRFPIGDLSTGLAETEDIEEAREGHEGGWKSATEHTSEHPFKRSVVLVPTDLLTTPPTEIDVLFHLHGHGIGYREGIKDADDKSAPVGFAYKGKVRDEVADNIAGQIPTTMAAVLPQGTRTSGFGSVAPQAMILEALQTVPGWGAVKPRRVMLGAYSGGGGSVPSLLGGAGRARRDDRIAERQKLVPGFSEVALFDAINGPGELGDIVSFVCDQIEADIAALSVLDEPKQKTYLESSMRFRGFFSAGSPTYGPLYTGTVREDGAGQGTVEGPRRATKPGKVPSRLPRRSPRTSGSCWRPTTSLRRGARGTRRRWVAATSRRR